MVIRNLLIRVLLVALLGALYFIPPRIKKHYGKGFHSLCIIPCTESRSEWETEPLDPLEKGRILTILSQTYKYCGRGSQCYVFESLDGQYVIKFFQQQRPVTPFTIWKQKIKKKRKFTYTSEEKKNNEFAAWVLAYQIAREETGVEYVHLNPTEEEWPVLVVKDPFNRTVHLKLDRIPFCVQKKVKPLKTALIDASHTRDFSECVNSYFSLLQKRVSKGIRNKDPSIVNNFGYIGIDSFEIDFSRYTRSPDYLSPEFQKTEMNKFVKKIREFIELNLPTKLDLFDRQWDEFKRGSPLFKGNDEGYEVKN